MNLSLNFSTDELETSQTAIRAGRPNKIPTHLLPNAKHLAQTILQPLRDYVMRPVFVTSGFRSGWLNRKVGGSPASAHVLALAADLVVTGMTPMQVCDLIDRIDLPYDQLIYEFGRWTHVSAAEPGKVPRRQKLTIGWRGNEVVTLAGFVPIIDGVIV
ncbi:MAG: peptidase M15A [Candidatus Saccharibacteria bacterium]|nr:peptidase M15A [Candidatus Saccharibacteria bacterium]